jgi:hypothetical protein
VKTSDFTFLNYFTRINYKCIEITAVMFLLRIGRLRNWRIIVKASIMEIRYIYTVILLYYIILSHVRVTIDGDWIGNWIY